LMSTLRRLQALIIGGLLTACAFAQPYETFPLDTTRVFGPDIRDVIVLRSAYSAQLQLGLLAWDGLACRLDAAGQVLDTPSISVDPRAWGLQPADVAAGPGGFAYVYEFDFDESSHVTVSMVAPDGSVSGLVALGSAYLCNDPAVASDRTGYLACWIAWDQTDLRIMSVRLDSAGSVLDSEPQVVAPGFALHPLDLDIVYGESTYLVVWREFAGGGNGDHMLGWLMRRDGSPVRDTAIDFGTDLAVGRPCAAFNGRDFVVTWAEYPYAVVAQCLSQSGEVLDPPGVPLTDDGWEPAVACLGDTSLFVWLERKFPEYEYTIRGVRLDGSLGKLDPDPFSLSQTVTTSSQDMPASPTVAATAAGFLVGWAHPTLGRTEWSYSNRDVVLRHVPSSGPLLDSSIAVASLAANSQAGVDAATCGNATLAVWTDYRPGAPETLQVRGRLFWPGGVPASDVIPIGPRYSCGQNVSSGTGGFLVVWGQADDSCVLAARVDTCGRLLDSVPVHLPSRSGRMVYGADVAYAGGVYFVIWAEEGGFARGARVRDDDGALLDSAALDLNPDGHEFKYTKVASDGSAFLVVGHTYGIGIRGLRVGLDGKVVDTAAFLIGENVEPPAVAFGDGLYLVITRLYNNVAWRVAPDGAVLDSAINLPVGYDARGVVFDGTDFLVGVTPIDDYLGPTPKVLGVRVSLDGHLVDPVPFPMMDAAWPGLYDRFVPACDTAGRLFLPGITVDTSPGFLASRAVAAYCPRLAVSDAASRPLPQGGPVVCPNPASRILTLDFAGTSASPTRVELFDATGRLAKCMSFVAGVRESHLDIDVRGLPGGVYFVVVAADGTRLSRKVVLTGR